MPDRALLRRGLVLLLLILVQAQVFAAATLPCRHAHPADVADHAHPCHSAPRASGPAGQTDPGEAWLLDCPTCTLLSVAGVFAPPISLQVGLVAMAHGPAPRERHFYQFVPERAERPPILRPS